MNRKYALVLILACGFVMTGFAQQKRPFDAVMKDVNTVFAGLRKNLDSNSMAAAVDDAAKLQALFKEAEDFWTPFKTRDAIDFAKGGQTASMAIAAAAREGNGQKAQAAYGSIGKYCKGCHDSHRELMPDKSFKIKP